MLRTATESTRKAVNRVVPAYPEMARTMNLKGNVKVEVVVGPSGAVKSVEIRGRSSRACQIWRERRFQVDVGVCARETRELVEIRFNP
jgi:hypothetical protein